ncbi:hypothetical protein [Limnobaculum parvum]|uniref:Uncharacterized protein n=1 Tax=Limnobaculum parvum TaxID=2172103 RepID=A0A2Y9TY02_9GAMM|nr:hypothetical protein [Limnobaculum parvum]AWH88628.1 hypothetical protein HYN51_08675 [Limnobaculum parvum]
MINVNELINQEITNEPVLVEGHVVYFNDGRLYLINLNYGSDYSNPPSIFIENDNLSDNLERNVSLYGGVSRLFHHAKIKGYIKINSISGELSLHVEEMTVENNKKWISIDLNKKYEPRNRDGIDWFDVSLDGKITHK